MINLYNEDCLQAMRKMDTDQYDLAIVDPPYGIKASNDSRFGKAFKDNTRPNSKPVKSKNYKISEWDYKIPSDEYFIQLFRISKNQIIWGGNYFIEKLKNTRCFIVWDKKNGNSNLADCELAWASFNTSVRKFAWLWNGFQKQKPEIRIHPTQKPVALYKWILLNYAKEGDTILDTHLGSGSIAVACHDMGFSLDGYELDTEYYEAACKRLKEHQRQLQLPI
jgi:site-specific DNA-methyltransferase (adenine-specific)